MLTPVLYYVIPFEDIIVLSIDSVIRLTSEQYNKKDPVKKNQHFRC